MTTLPEEDGTMRRSLLATTARIVAYALLTLLVPAPSRAQSFSCLPQNGFHNTHLQTYIQGLVTATPGSERDSARVESQLSTGTASSVVIQKQKNLCTQAAQAYHVAVAAAGTPQISRQVAVVKVGSNRYVVWDPTERFGEFGVYVVFDTTFTVINIFVG